MSNGDCSSITFEFGISFSVAVNVNVSPEGRFVSVPVAVKSMSITLTIVVTDVTVVLPEVVGVAIAPARSESPISCSGARMISIGWDGGSVVNAPLRNSQPQPWLTRADSWIQSAMNQSAFGCGARLPAYENVGGLPWLRNCSEVS